MKDCIVYDKWLPYEEYEKAECDIKLTSGKIINHCYPNAGKFNPMCSDHIDQIPEEQVEEIRYREYYLKDLCHGSCNAFSKEQAIKYMKEGKRVTHYHFSDHEWITMEGGKIITEEGYRLDSHEFWHYRQTGFENDWRLYKDQPEEKEEYLIGGMFAEPIPYHAGPYDWTTEGVVSKPSQYIREKPKVQNNEPCICGSGKKYKKCCK